MEYLICPAIYYSCFLLFLYAVRYSLDWMNGSFCSTFMVKWLAHPGTNLLAQVQILAWAWHMANPVVHFPF